MVSNMPEDNDYKEDFDELNSDYGDEEVHVPKGFDLRYVHVDCCEHWITDNLQISFANSDTLPESTLVEMTTEQLHELIHQGYIDLNPPYQRGQSLSEA